MSCPLAPGGSRFYGSTCMPSLAGSPWGPVQSLLPGGCGWPSDGTTLTRDWCGAGRNLGSNTTVLKCWGDVSLWIFHTAQHREVRGVDLWKSEEKEEMTQSNLCCDDGLPSPWQVVLSASDP